MKIWLDLRFLHNKDRYSKFVAILVQYLIHLDKENRYTLYLNKELQTPFPKELNVKYIEEKPGSFLEQIKFQYILKKDANDLMIFFNEKKPLLYKWTHITFIKDLKELHYKKEESTIKEKIQDLFINTSVWNANKVICFDSQTLNELNEKLNVAENKIEILYPFFTKDKITNNPVISNIKTKYQIKWEYLIYSWWVWNNKNLSKLIDVFDKLYLKKENIYLVILEQDLVEDAKFRKEIINKKCITQIKFVWETTPEEKKAFYNEAIWTIFPSLYESFPFDLTEAISYNSPILASNLKQIKEIMWNTIAYFSPLSAIDMLEAIENFVENWKQKVDYKEIFEKYNPEKTAKNLIEIIKKI